MPALTPTLSGGAVPEGSRGLSASDTPGVSRPKSRTPEGCQTPSLNARVRLDAFFDPSGVVSLIRSIRGYRRFAPQPPATSWQPSGLRVEKCA